jgi:hypothetical protein
MVLSPKQKLIAIAMEKSVKIMNVNWEGSVWSQLFEFPQEHPVVDVHFAGSSRLVVITSNGSETFMRVYFLELISAFIDNGGVSHSEGPLISIPSSPGRLLTPNGQFLILLDDMLCASVYDLDIHLKLPKFQKPITGQILTSPTSQATPSGNSITGSAPGIVITAPLTSTQAPPELAMPELKNSTLDQPSTSAEGTSSPNPESLASLSSNTEKVSLGTPVASLMIAPKFHRFVLPSKITMLTINNHLFLVGLTDDGLECLALEDLQGMNTTARSVSMAPNLISTLESSTNELPPYGNHNMKLSNLNPGSNTTKVNTSQTASSTKPTNANARLSTLCAPVLHLFSDRRQVTPESPVEAKLNKSNSSESVSHESNEEVDTTDRDDNVSASSAYAPVTVHFVVAGLDTKTMSTLSCRQMFKLIVANSSSDTPYSESSYTLSDLPPNITVLVSSQGALENLRAPLVLPLTTKSAKQPESLQHWFTSLIGLLPLRIARVVNDKLIIDQSTKLNSAPIALGNPRQNTSLSSSYSYPALLGAYHALLNDWSGPIKVVSSIGTPTRHHLATKVFKMPSTVIPPEDLHPGVYLSSSVVSNTTLASAPCLYLHLDIIPSMDVTEMHSRRQLILFACAVSTSLIWHSSHDETDTFTLIFKLLDEVAESISKLNLTAADDGQNVLDPSVAHFAGKLFVFMSNVVASAQASSVAKLFKETYKESRKTKKNFTSRLFGNNLPSLFLFSDVNSLTYNSSTENLKQAIESLPVKSEMGERFAGHLCFVLSRISEFGQAQAQSIQLQARHGSVDQQPQQSHAFQTMPIMSSNDLPGSNTHHLLVHGHNPSRHSEQVHPTKPKSPLKTRRDKSAPASPRTEISPRRHVQPPLRSATTTRKLQHNNGAIVRSPLEVQAPVAGPSSVGSTVSATAAVTTPASPRFLSSSSAISTAAGSAVAISSVDRGNPVASSSPVASPRRLSPATSALPTVIDPNEIRHGGSKSSDELVVSQLDILSANLESAIRTGLESSGSSLTIPTASSLRVISDPLVEIGQLKLLDAGLDVFSPETARMVTKALVEAQVPPPELHSELSGLLEYLLTRRLTRVGAWIDEYLDTLEVSNADTDAKIKRIRDRFLEHRQDLQSNWALCEQHCNQCALTCAIPSAFHESMSDLGLVLIDSEEPIGESSEDGAVRRMGATYRHDCATNHRCVSKCEKCDKQCGGHYGHEFESTHDGRGPKHDCKEAHPCGSTCHLAAFKLRGCGLTCSLPHGHNTLGHAGHPHDCLNEHMCNQYCAFCDQYCQFKFTEKHKSHTCGQTVCSHSCEIHKHCSRPCVLGHNHTEMHYCGVKDK